MPASQFPDAAPTADDEALCATVADTESVWRRTGARSQALAASTSAANSEHVERRSGFIGPNLVLLTVSSTAQVTE